MKFRKLFDLLPDNQPLQIIEVGKSKDSKLSFTVCRNKYYNRDDVPYYYPWYEVKFVTTKDDGTLLVGLKA